MKTVTRVAGDPGEYIWNGVNFPLNQPVPIDPAAGDDPVRQRLMQRILVKAADNPMFGVAEAKAEKADAVPDPKPRKRTARHK